MRCFAPLRKVRFMIPPADTPDAVVAVPAPFSESFPGLRTEGHQTKLLPGFDAPPPLSRRLPQPRRPGTLVPPAATCRSRGSGRQSPADGSSVLKAGLHSNRECCGCRFQSPNRVHKDNLRIAAGDDVLCGHHPLFDSGGRSPFQNHRFIRPLPTSFNKKVLYVPAPTCKTSAYLATSRTKRGSTISVIIGRPVSSRAC